MSKSKIKIKFEKKFRNRSIALKNSSKNLEFVRISKNLKAEEKQKKNNKSEKI